MMMKRVYIDQNVIIDMSDSLLVLKPEPSILWVYSNEHFVEIARGGDTRHLDVLGRLRARKLELKLDDAFRITGEAKLLGESDPHHLYEAWQAANAEVSFGDYFSPVLSRLFGSENADALSLLPDSIEQDLSDLLELGGPLDQTQKDRIVATRHAFETLVFDFLAERPNIEVQREALGTHGGRAGNLAEHDNPLDELWSIVGKVAPGLTADQFYGFDPPERGAYEEWPLYLGIVGCYMVLNMVGLRPDEKVARVERMPAIASDASHTGHAAYCHALLSADRRLCDKARAIYRYKNISTKVMRLEGAANKTMEPTR